MDELAVRKVVEGQFGSFEELALRFVGEPGLLDLGVEAVASRLGLDVRVVVWLLRESVEFRALLDSWVAQEVWSASERVRAYGVLKDRIVSGADRLGDSVRAMEYLDSKVGLERGNRGAPQVAIQIVQEGDGSWESDFEGLEFGGEGSSSSGGSVDAVDVEFE